MQRNLNYQNERPTLYLIPTPIGNLEDITLRSLKILETVDVLYAEDTRVTRKLLSHYNISKTIFSLHEHNEVLRYKEVIEKLDKGLNVGLVSDAGMPLLSDPGLILAKEVKAAGYNVTSLPGANALLPALAMSGLNTHPFAFFGFLDRKVVKGLRSWKELNIILRL
jgi:16S rRNA (cytidine1402-2'-O)-methyltransferase